MKSETPHYQIDLALFLYIKVYLCTCKCSLSMSAQGLIIMLRYIKAISVYKNSQDPSMAVIDLYSLAVETERMLKCWKCPVQSVAQTSRKGWVLSKSTLCLIGMKMAYQHCCVLLREERMGVYALSPMFIFIITVFRPAITSPQEVLMGENFTSILFHFKITFFLNITMLPFHNHLRDIMMWPTHGKPVGSGRYIPVVFKSYDIHCIIFSVIVSLFPSGFALPSSASLFLLHTTVLKSKLFLCHTNCSHSHSTLLSCRSLRVQFGFKAL